MKIILLLLIAFSCFAVQAQDTRAAKQTKRIFMGINFLPAYNFRTLKNNDGNAATSLLINNRNNKEIGKFGYSAGLNLCINISNHLAFETGIQYSNKGYKTKNEDLIFLPPDPNAPTRAKFIYAFQYMGIPVKANFSFGKNKVRFITGLGFATNILINQKNSSIAEYADGRKEKKSQSSTSNYKKLDISPLISIGIDYKINNQVHFKAEPTFSYGLLKTVDAPVKEHLWSAGLNMGFYYGLK